MDSPKFVAVVQNLATGEITREERDFTPEEIAAAAAVSVANARARMLPLTQRQLRLWLVSAGLGEAAVDGQIAAIPEESARAAAEIEWQRASQFVRSHPLVAQLGAALGLSNEQIDAAFVAAAAL